MHHQLVTARGGWLYTGLQLQTDRRFSCRPIRTFDDRPVLNGAQSRNGLCLHVSVTRSMCSGQWRRNRGFNKPGSRAPGAPESGAKNFMQEKNMRHILFLRNFLGPSIPVLALGGRPRELRTPSLLLNEGPSEPCYATVAMSQGGGWRGFNHRLVSRLPVGWIYRTPTRNYCVPVNTLSHIYASTTGTLKLVTVTVHRNKHMRTAL